MPVSSNSDQSDITLLIDKMRDDFRDSFAFHVQLGAMVVMAAEGKKLFSMKEHVNRLSDALIQRLSSTPQTTSDQSVDTAPPAPEPLAAFKSYEVVASDGQYIVVNARCEADAVVRTTAFFESCIRTKSFGEHTKEECESFLKYLENPTGHTVSVDDSVVLKPL